MAGYIAPRHLKAIKQLHGKLVLGHDLSDSVGIVDRYFPHADFTADPAVFADALSKKHIDYLTVCTPNYLHYDHSILGLAAGASVICEKPLALTCRELDRMEQAESVYGRRIHPILQLRLHPEIVRLKQRMDGCRSDRRHEVELTYITPRGKWYNESWKGDRAKSGGVVFNIGIHFIDMLLWVFGALEDVFVYTSARDSVAGVMELRKARVKFFLSVDPAHSPQSDAGEGFVSYRHLSFDGESFDFSNGFTDLHTDSYARILAGEGFSIADVRPAVIAAEKIAGAKAVEAGADAHPFFSLHGRE